MPIALLTSPTPENKNETMDKLYPDHAHTLKKAKLAPEQYPTLKEVLQKARIQSENCLEWKVRPGDSPEIIEQKEKAIKKKAKDKN